MTLWLTGGLLLLHSLWRVYKSGSIVAAFALMISYFTLTMVLHWLLPFLFWQPLYYPLFYPYVILAGAALLWLLAHRLRGQRLPPDWLLSNVFVAVLALHAGLLLWCVLEGWGAVLLAYTTLPPLVCCTVYLIYRLLLWLPGSREGEWSWFGVGLLGFGGASFIVLSSVVILPIYGLLRPVLFP